jgi:hypothetical protein
LEKIDVAHTVVALIALLIIVLVLNDVFETIVLPRRVSRRWHLAGILLRLMWAPWHAIALRQRQAHRREEFLSYFGRWQLSCFWLSG